MTQLFDACASWWTQGPDATLQVILVPSEFINLSVDETWVDI